MVETITDSNLNMLDFFEYLQGSEPIKFNIFLA